MNGGEKNQSYKEAESFLAASHTSIYRLVIVAMVFLISTLEEYFSFLDKIEPNTLFYGLLAFTWIVSIWEHYLSYRQVDSIFFSSFELKFISLLI
jgi:hypothetical protein